MKKEIGLPALGIIAGELMMFYSMLIGLTIHVINLQAINIALIFGNFSSEIKKVHQSLLLLLLMRIINLAMPQFFTITLLWYPLIYGVMFIPVYLIIKNQRITSKELGVSFKRLHIYLPAALLIGLAAALLEYRILHPTSLIENVQLSNLILITIVMFVFVGAVEELVFRSILQTRLEKVLGLRYGLLLSSILFGIMHAGYGIINEILFASLFGVVLGYVFQKTRSFPFILTIHGTANVLLFGILPIRDIVNLSETILAIVGIIFIIIAVFLLVLLRKSGKKIEYQEIIKEYEESTKKLKNENAEISKRYLEAQSKLEKERDITGTQAKEIENERRINSELRKEAGAKNDLLKKSEESIQKIITQIAELKEKDVTAATRVKEIENERMKNNELRRKLEGYEETIQKLRNEIAEINSRYQDTTEKLDKATDKVACLEMLLIDLDKELGLLNLVKNTDT